VNGLIKHPRENACDYQRQYSSAKARDYSKQLIKVQPNISRLKSMDYRVDTGVRGDFQSNEYSRFRKSMKNIFPRKLEMYTATLQQSTSANVPLFSL
jgi:hypothetical protein